jgi:ATP-dependent helicase/nuclease subunit B
MFEPSPRPRLFAQAPGADFPAAVVAGLIARTRHLPPDALARVELFVNTRRMQRRIKALFDAGPALLLPRIRLVTDLGLETGFADLPPPVPPLRRRLELGQLIARLLDEEPDLAPRAAVYDLADSLVRLMDEMQGEGIKPAAIRKLDISDQSGHWHRSLKFIRLVDRYFGKDSVDFPDTEGRQRLVIERLVTQWSENPPAHPVIVAGSTGSRGATALFMQAVTRLPQGAVILPGYDFDLPGEIWDGLDNALAAEDHPQFRFARLLQVMGSNPSDVSLWDESALPPSPARNRLVSLSLRPAPVTDQWQIEGRQFTGIDDATAGMTLIEAPSPRAEAAAIAIRLRKAADEGQTAALITPDRMLTRQVTAALDRWGIEPDDSAGHPLPLTAPGRFLRHIANLFGARLTSHALLTLLKHPLTSSGGTARGDHLRWTRDLELECLRGGTPFPDGGDLRRWAAKHAGDSARLAWAEWLVGLLCGLEAAETCLLADHLENHLRIANALAAGPCAAGSGALWDKRAGQEAARVVGTLEREAEHGGLMSPSDYADFFASVLNSAEVRDPVTPHPGIMIWGTLEARVQGADLVILAGLNDGIWPQQPAPDPWMNRAMRHAAGLLLPERRIGLSAHDFQQAIGAQEVVLTRAIRDAENETVASRWLNRLVNLLTGMSSEGATALARMRARGQEWLDLARLMDQRAEGPLAPASRPSPLPPVAARPKRLSVTRITKLIRDPYAVYAEAILGLRPLDALHQTPDAPLRGTILHLILDRFVAEADMTNPKDARHLLLAIADEVLKTSAPWPAARQLWRAKLERVADWFIEGEQDRARLGRNLANERRGELFFPSLDFTLSAEADRIDQLHNGTLAIYDYKTGTVPTLKQQAHFDKQLLLEAVIAEAGGFWQIDGAPVTQAAYIGLGSTPKFMPIQLEQSLIQETKSGLGDLIAKYQLRIQGYTSRRAVERNKFEGDYDHLARHGEWDDTQDPEPEEVGE